MKKLLVAGTILLSTTAFSTGVTAEFDKQSKVEERKIFEFNQLKSLRAE